MKALSRAVLLLAVIVGAVIWLRSISPKAPVVSHKDRSTLAGPIEDETSGGFEDLSAEQLFEAGTALLGGWRPREAARALKAAVRADSTHQTAWLRLVECYDSPLARDEDARAVAMYHAARLAATPEDSFFVQGVRRLYVDHDYAAAVGHLRTALRFDTHHPDTRLHFARALYHTGDFAAVDAELRTLLKDGDTTGRVIELAVRNAVARGEIDAAEQHARDLARTFNEEPFAYVLLALVEQQRGNVDAAQSYCNTALNLDQRYVPAIVVGANLYLAAGNVETAQVAYEKLLMFDDPVTRGVAHESLAFLAFVGGEFENGVTLMDTAVREAMVAGSPRYALTLARELIVYLCELGRADVAAEVLDRWVSGFGEIPVRLARLRIDILNGKLTLARRTLVDMRTSRDFQTWVCAMDVDAVELAALVQIGDGRVDDAHGVLAGAQGSRDRYGRRTFLEGFTSFKSGDAESAAGTLAAAHASCFGMEFPYRGDPIVYVQSQFYIAESAIARGDTERAREMYTSFLDHWGQSDWDVAAVARARTRLEQLQATDESPAAE